MRSISSTPVHVGEPEVDDHAVVGRAVEGPQRFRAGADRGDRDLAGLDEVGHRGELGDVVLDHQHVARRVSANPRSWSKAWVSASSLAGFFKWAKAPESSARCHCSSPEITWTGMVLVGGIAFELIEQLPAVDVGQADVERDRVGDVLPREREPFAPGPRDEPFEAAVAREPEQDPAERRRRPRRSG